MLSSFSNKFIIIYKTYIYTPTKEINYYFKQTSTSTSSIIITHGTNADLHLFDLLKLALQ